MTGAGAVAGGGERPAAPFVVGVARSGTTLLRMMLDSHPALAIPPETHFAGRAIAAFAPGGGGVEAAVAAIVEGRFWPDFGIPVEEFADAVASRADPTPGDLLRVFYETYATRAGKRRWGDKTPPYLERMGEIHAVLPEARFVHVIRDGRDVALSAIPLWFGPGSVEEAARQWRDRIAAARERARELLPAYLEVRYEDLVRGPRDTLAAVCEFLDLPWDSAMLDYHRRAEAQLARLDSEISWYDGSTISAADRIRIHRLTAEPPRRDRIERWRTLMPPADIRAFERLAGPTLEELGYPLR